MAASFVQSQLSKYGLPFAPVQANAINSKTYRYLNQVISVLIYPEQTGGSFGVLQMQEKRGMEPPPHIHTREDEVFIIQTGKIEFTVSGTTYECGAGDVMFLPRNRVHHLKVITPVSDVMNILTPGNFINYFLEMCAEQELLPADSNEMPVAPIMFEKLIAIATRYGVRFPHLENMSQ